MNITEWFPAHIKPAHVGWYHTKALEEQICESGFNWWWDGSAWCHDECGGRTSYQDRIWRGLKEPA